MKHIPTGKWFALMKGKIKVKKTREGSWMVDGDDEAMDELGKFLGECGAYARNSDRVMDTIIGEEIEI